MIKRERAEKWTALSVLVNVIGSASGLGAKTLEQLSTLYYDELFQDRYTRMYALRKSLKAAKVAKKKQADEDLLKKLDAYTDKTSETAPRPKRRK